MTQIICCFFFAADGATEILFLFTLTYRVFKWWISLASYLQDSIVLVETKLLIWRSGDLALW